MLESLKMIEEIESGRESIKLFHFFKFRLAESKLYLMMEMKKLHNSLEN